MAKDAVKAGLAVDGHDWVDRARVEVLAALADAPDGSSAQEIRRMVPMIDVKVEVSPGAFWSGIRVITYLGAGADIVRGANTAGWQTSRPRWTLTRNWLDEVPLPLSAAEGYREIVRRWLYTFGPGTEDDIVWWLGATKTVVRAALAELDAAPVSLERGSVGWMLPDDLDEIPDPGPWVALLPLLDPTVMGWRGRDFYLGPHREQLFDRTGNAGTTAWVDGRVVGCWVQDEAGAVRVRLLDEVSGWARSALDGEAARLTQWLGGHRLRSPYLSPAMVVSR
jgi:hypothetical protein